jgi:hypothetical protein
MSSNSWRQYGGRSISLKETINVGTVVAEQFLTRKTTAIKTTFERVDILGELTVEGDTTLKKRLFVGGDQFNSNNLYVNKKLLFGTDEKQTDSWAYISGNQKNIGINTTSPSTIFDITGNDSNILTVETTKDTIRNIIGQNVNKKGLVVTAGDTSSNIYFYNDTSTNIANDPDAYIRYGTGKMLTLYSTNINLSFDSGIVKFDENGISMITKGNIISESSGNIISTSNKSLSYNYISDTSNSSIIIDNSGIQFKTTDNIYYTTNENGKILLNTNITEISSNLVVSKNGIFNNIYDETTTIYDSSNSYYLPDIYDNSFSKTGNAITLVAIDNSSNTTARIVAPNNIGLSVVGGSFVNDTSRSFGSISLTDISKNNILSSTIVSGKNPIKYHSTVGINTYSPKTENYVLDINGATHIGNGEINILSNVDFQINYMKFSKIDTSYGIAVGTPKTYDFTSGSLNSDLYILYTSNGGINWNISQINNTVDNVLSLIQYNSSDSLKLSVYNKTYSVIGIRDNILVSYDGGIIWKAYSYPSGGYIPNITSLASTMRGNNYRIIMFYNIDLNTNIYVDIIDITNINDTNISWFSTSNRHIQINNNITTPIKTPIIDSIVSKNNICYLITSDKIYYFDKIDEEIPLSSSPAILTTPNINNIIYNYKLRTSSSYNNIDIFNTDPSNYIIIFIGKNIITVYSSKSDYTGPTISSNYNDDINFKSVFIRDLSLAVAVGDNGVFWYSNELSKSNSWNPVPFEILNSSGIGNRIKGKDLTGIFMYNIDTFLISNVIQKYNPNTSSNGKSQIMLCYYPNLFNRSNNMVIDVSGNMVISGDININDEGQLLSNNNIFNVFLNSPSVKQIYIGNRNASTAINGNLYVGGDVSFNNRLFVGGDVSFNNRLFVGGDVSFNNRLFVGGDVSFNSRLFVGGDVSFNNRFFVGGDVSFNNRLFVGGDVSFNNRLFVDRDVSFNNRLFVGGDVSFNQKLFVRGDVSINANLTISNNNTIFCQNFDSSNGYLNSYYRTDLFDTTYNSMYFGINSKSINLGSYGVDTSGTSKLNTDKKIITIGSGGFFGKLSDATTIYIGGTGDTIHINGNTIFQNQTQMTYNSPLLMLNCPSFNNVTGEFNPTPYPGASYDGNGNLSTKSLLAGISIAKDNDNYAAYMIVSNDTSGYVFKAAGSTNAVNLNVGSLTFTSKGTGLYSTNNINNGILVLTTDNSTRNYANYAITVKPIDVSNIFLRDNMSSTDTTQQIASKVKINDDLTILSNFCLFVGGDTSLNGNLFAKGPIYQF